VEYNRKPPFRADKQRSASKMRHKHKALVGLGATAVIVGILGVFVWIQRIRSAYATEYPESWRMIQPGMISHEARELLGEPYTDGRGLKLLDRWQQTHHGVQMHLDLWFDEGSEKDAAVTRVVMWKQILGQDADLHVDPPFDHAAEQSGARQPAIRQESEAP
jgi:hypothetical protein